MSTTESRIQELLSPQQIESLQYAQTFFGQKATEAAVEVAEALELGEEAKAQLSTQVSVRLETANFSQRARVAEKLTELAVVLKGGDKVIERKNLALIEPSARPAPGTVVETAKRSTPVTGEEQYTPLKKRQKTWLLKILPPETVDEIGQLSSAQRMTFAQALGDAYCKLRISRLSPEAKRNRAAQLEGFLAGMTYDELAELAGTSRPAIVQAIGNIAGTIARQIPTHTIEGFIDRSPPMPEGVSQPETTEQSSSLSKDMANWYKKIFAEVDIEQIEDLADFQRAHLAELLARRLRSYGIKRHGSIKIAQRVGQMTRLIEGEPYDTIAQHYDIPVASLKKELHNVALSLAKRTPASDLKYMVRHAASFKKDTE